MQVARYVERVLTRIALRQSKLLVKVGLLPVHREVRELSDGFGRGEPIEGLLWFWQTFDYTIEHEEK